jgi:hypothetical protein
LIYFLPTLVHVTRYSILDFFIFPYLKNTIFKNNLHNLEELQEATSNACNAITVQMQENAFENMQRRVNTCVEAGGEHFETLSVILNKTTLSFCCITISIFICTTKSSVLIFKCTKNKRHLRPGQGYKVNHVFQFKYINGTCDIISFMGDSI